MSYAGVDYDDSWYLSKCRNALAAARDERDALAAVIARCRALVADWQANGNSRELGDPTDRVWFECARQLLAALDGKEVPR